MKASACRLASTTSGDKQANNPGGHVYKTVRLVFLTIILLTAVTLCGADPPTPGQPPIIKSAAPLSASVPRYACVEIAVDVDMGAGGNPFDPDDEAIDTRFTSPSGKDWRIPGYFGTAGWRIRFSPDEIGDWRYVVTAKSKSGTASASGRFAVTASRNPGFVRVGKANPEGFAFDNGQPYFAVGENMCWGHRANPIADYEAWLPKLHAARGNYIRIWVCGPGLRIDWASVSGAPRLGAQDLANADELDRILDLADANDVHVMLTLGTYGELASGGFFKEGQWAKNPYNAVNGGPCAQPDDFWNIPSAIKLYRNRLRYLMARYGARTCVMSWEFWNEAHPTASWVAAMGQFVKGTGPYAGHPADPYRHLLTTSYGSDDIWRLPEIDWTQTHFYGDSGNVADLTPTVIEDAHQFARYNKPHMMTEFGIDWRKSDIAYDPEGVGTSLHNAIWAAAASGDAGTAMIWWWDTYVDPKNLYAQFTPLADIASRIDWTTSPWKPLKFSPVTVIGGPETLGDAVLPAGTGFAKADVSDFTIGRDGGANAPVGPTYIFSPSKAALRTVPTFHVDYPEAGQFIVHVDRVSGTATLDLSIDGKLAREVNFDARPPSDPAVVPAYKSTRLEAQWNVYQALFDQDYAIDVPAGQHTITLEDTKGDWISVREYRLTNYKSSRFANVRMTGITNGNDALIWAQNTDSTWQSAFEKHPIAPVVHASVVVNGYSTSVRPVSNSLYDTHTGKSIKNDVLDLQARHAMASGNKALSVNPEYAITLPIKLPELSDDCVFLVGPMEIRF